MNGRIEPGKPPQPIDLAAETDFTLGVLLIQPSLRRVSFGGREELVEPRVMQALIALAQAGGTVVSRDALIERCWAGRIVGEDAINRCIAKVRKLAEVAEPAPFTIETVSKVGYRLLVSDGTAAIEPPAAAAVALPALEQAGPAYRDKHDGRRMLGWREAGIAAVILVIAASVSVLTWRPASPLVRPRPAASQEPFNPPPHTVAVLAFDNLSNDPAQEYLSDGLAEAVIDVLSRVDQLRVTARTSSFTFKGQAATIEEIGHKLNVGAVLEGSLRRQGSRLRIDARLSDARTGFPLWSQSYDRSTADLLKLQDEIAGDAAEALQVKLGEADAAGRVLGGTTNPLAFDAYLRGEQQMRSMGEGRDAALAEFRTAIALDPNFALAHSRLAFILVMICQTSTNDDTYRAMMAEARRAAERAIALAPDLGIAHSNFAFVLRNEVRDMNEAWIEARRAKVLSPGNAIVETQYALIASIVGHVAEAIQAANRATELDPIRAEPWFALNRVLACARRYDAARDAVQRSMTLISHPLPQGVSDLGSLLIKEGEVEDGRRICATLPDYGCMAIADHALGKTDDANKELTEMISENGVSDAYHYSVVYAQWHEPELARQWLTKAREINDPALSQIRCDAFQDPMRNQPWFKQIEQSLHFPPPE